MESGFKGGINMKSKCETCYYCKMTNGKCHKNKKQNNSGKCKDYVKSTVTRQNRNFKARKDGR